MSKRAIKRYQQAQMLQSQSDHDESEEEYLDSPKNPINHFSMFELLGDEDDQSVPSDDASPSPTSTNQLEENENEKIGSTLTFNQEDNQNELLAVSSSNQNLDEPLPPKATSQKKGKKKKKKRGKKSAQRKTDSTDRDNDPDWIALRELSLENEQSQTLPDSLFNSDDDEDVRLEAQKIMKAISEEVKRREGQLSTENSEYISQFGIKIEQRHLNAEFELRKRFGSRAVENERRHDDEELNQNVRRKRHVKRTLNIRKKFSLVTPRDNWIDRAPGLEMVLDENETKANPDGIRYFRYTHESSYRRIQEEYLLVVQQHDPNLLVQLINQYPFHVDTILQLAELHRQMGELDRAAEFIEMSLYLLESAWNFTFKPFDGSCRMKFDVIENRPLFVALFRYSQLLTRRGLHRTALEISKLLLNLDPDNDPMGVLMTIDSFALLSEENQWICEMYNNYKNIPTRFFPNFAASTALAQKVQAEKSNEPLNSSKQSAKELLIEVLLTFPMLLRPILAAISDNSSLHLDYRLFDENWYGAGYDDSGILNRISRVHAERCKLLWKAPTNKELLIACAKEAGRLDDLAGAGIDPETQQQTSALVADESKHPRVAHCRSLRAEAGNWMRESGLYRGIQIADFADSTTNIPAQLLAQEPIQERLPANPPRQMSTIESAMEFLASMAPWRDIPDNQ